jgi:hypothetical protein
VLLAVAALATLPAASDAQVAARPARAERWSLDAQYLHVGSGPISRRASRSLGATLGFDLARSSGTGVSWRAEGGWMRVARENSTAQGATLGASVGVPVGRGARRGDARLTLRPGVAALLGWEEAQGETPLYDWRGLPATGYAGQTGTQGYRQPARANAAGGGVSLGAELRVSRGLSVTGSVREWLFAGDVIRADRSSTLGGLGLAIRPAAFAADAGRLWKAGLRTVGGGR